MNDARVLSTNRFREAELDDKPGLVNHFPDNILCFEPTIVHAMVGAFQEAWERLRNAGDIRAAEHNATQTQHQLARRIVEIARQGEVDPIILREYALRSNSF